MPPPEPMLATLADAPLNDAAFVYEPKYDGIRAIAEVPAGGDGVRLWSRLGNEKTRQFPEVARALATWAKRRKDAAVLDGEIVALDAEGRPTGFQHLQGRIHVLGMVKGRRMAPSTATRVPKSPKASPPAGGPPVAFVAFDVLRIGSRDLRGLPLAQRREQLEGLIGTRTTESLRLSEQTRGDGRAMQARALAEGWEGLIAKRATSIYRSGKRSPDWCKLKIVHEQEFVVGGWTEPRQSRTHFGALLLGVYDDAPTPAGRLLYSGHVGTGFDQRELARVMALMAPLEAASCPFVNPPATNEHPHWLTPQLVAQVRFSEWTADGILRHPVYLGLRDDKKASAVRREETKATPRPTRARATTSTTRRSPKKAAEATVAIPDAGAIASLVNELAALEKARKDAVVAMPGGGQLKVSNLHKVFWPKQKLTKGDLLRYYARVSPFLLPVIADRPLVMKRFPNGVAEKPFYQHRVDDVPAGVRMAAVDSADGREQIVGGDILTLLYTAQLAAISQDPWFSRIGSQNAVDFVALDLDPSPGLSFDKVCSVALWIRDELARLDVPNVVKTSGADGMHIYIPLPPETTYEAGLLFAQIVATLVSERHPREATIERSLKARGAKVYVDYLQNIQGKTLACAYSARASDYAGVSTPLSWTEIERGVTREHFTIETVPDRLRVVGDLWQPLRESAGVDLDAVTGVLSGAPPKRKPRRTRG